MCAPSFIHVNMHTHIHIFIHKRKERRDKGARGREKGGKESKYLDCCRWSYGLLKIAQSGPHTVTLGRIRTSADVTEIKFW